MPSPPPPSNQGFPSQASPPPPSGFHFLNQPTFPSSNLFGSQIQTPTQEKENINDEKELDANKIYELPEIPKLELGDRLANVLGTEGEQILDDNFLQAKELEDKNIKEIAEQYEFNKIKDAFDEGTIPPQSDFFYGEDHLTKNFKHACNILSLNDENIGFVDFRCSDRGQNIMISKSLSIHVESRDIFYQNFNTNETFYSFLLAQQDETKSVVPKRISYSYSFEKYIHSYLPSFSIDDVEKYDLYLNKNAKYLLYKFKDWIESMEGEKLLIRHTAKTKYVFSLNTIESRDKQFLIEKLIHNIEF